MSEHTSQADGDGIQTSSDSPGDLRTKLNDIFEVVDRLRSELRTLSRRIEQSSYDLLVLRERRDELESTLEKELAKAGALVYDWQAVGHELKFRSNSDPSEDGGGPDSEDATEDGDPENEAPASQSTRNATEEQNPPTDDQANNQTDTAEAKTTPSLSFVGEDSGANRPTDEKPKQQPDESRDPYRIAQVFPDVKESLGSPPDEDAGYPELVAEANLLKRATTVDQLEKWSSLPDEVQTCLASYIAARTRHLQSGIDAGSVGTVLGEDDVRGIFARLNKHMEKYEPGFAHGLARDHTAKNDSWLADARKYADQLDDLAYEYYGEETNSKGTSQNTELALNEIERFLDDAPDPDALRKFIRGRLDNSELSPDDPRLVSLLEPFRDHFRGHGFTKLRKALEPNENGPDGEEDAVELPDDWEWKDKVEASRMLVVGADSRPDAEARIEETFQPAEFSWVNVQDKKNVRKVESWGERIRQGNVDIVVLLTDYVSHSVSDLVVDAVKDSPNADLVFVNRGYGVEQIRQGIENFVEIEIGSG